MLAEISRTLAGEERNGALPAPTAWWNYTLDEDVVMWVRADRSPWRLKQVRRVLDELAARLTAEKKRGNVDAPAE